MTRPARARIDLAALQHNFQCVQQAAPGSRVMAIVKANGYGHGLVDVARALPEADAFGVVTLDEAISLREAGFDRRIVLLEGFFGADDIPLVDGYRMDVVLHHDRQIEVLEQRPPGRALDAWLKIDTGMNRLGFAPPDVPGAIDRLAQLGCIGSLRLMSHLACADDPDRDYTSRQLEHFTAATRGLQGERSLANSAGLLAWPGTRMDWVRPGIMLYGASPLLGRPADELDLRPVMTLTTRLIAINRHQAGDAVGYGGDWVCPEPMNVGVAAIGYGDGYPRHAPSGTPVLVNGQRTSIIGRVSMDMICIDLRAQPAARVDDAVVLWGEGLPVDEVAARAGTIAYELLCSVNKRVHFDYME
jgi:alanine racemase